MLALHQDPAKLREARNLVPMARAGGMETRPGAIQVLDGEVLEAAGWGERFAANRRGRIVIWEGGTATDLCPAGLLLRGAAFQALTADAAREDRLFVADGVNALWYVAKRAGVFVREFVANTILDSDGQPYPIPVPVDIATWRNRLWILYGTNRAQHCQNDAPAEWDPLWTVECQGDQPGQARALEPHGEALLVGMDDAVWAVTGDSQYNWARGELMRGGVTGPGAIASDRTQAYYANNSGLWQAGRAEPLSDDLRELFNAPVGPAEVMIDTRRRWVLFLVASRLFVMHQERPGEFGEIEAAGVYGLLRVGQQVGWYGADGVWLLGARDTPDQWLDGTATDFLCRYDTWEGRPNLAGNGRALCNRTILQVAGSTRGTGTYRVTADGVRAASATFTLADETVGTWQDDIETQVAQAWPTRAVRRELVPRLPGETFRHTVEARCHMELQAFAPQYRYGLPERKRRRAA